MKNKTFKIISVIVFLLAITLLAAVTVPLVFSYDDPVKLKAYVEGLGFKGFVMMFFVQIAQIVVALIPGEVVEFVSGALYGCFGGLLFCLAGIIIGQTIIYQSVKIFGSNFVEKVAGSKIMNKYKFLQDEKKLKSLIFFLFFIPGTPKDMLTYIVPLTKVKLRDFILITTFARIPSVISSTFAGAAFKENDYFVLIISYVAIAAFTLIGTLMYKFVYLKYKFSDKNKNNDSKIKTTEKESILAK